MKILGFQYKKMNSEKNTSDLEGVKIETSLNIDSILENPSKNVPKGEVFLDISFNSIINYSKEIAKIEIGGLLIISVESSVGKEILKKWKKKEIDEEIRANIFNIIITKTNIKALEIEDTLNLPPHFRMPYFSPKK